MKQIENEWSRSAVYGLIADSYSDLAAIGMKGDQSGMISIYMYICFSCETASPEGR